MSNEVYKMHPIGRVKRSNDAVRLELSESYRPALNKLDKFSHVIVFWWAHKHDSTKSRNIMQTELPYAEGTTAGVFACRAEYRPNPIAMTTCKISAVDEKGGVVQIADIDAYDDTPVLDLKPYIPVCDRLREVRVPQWFADWPEWMPEEGLGLEEH